MLRTPNFPHSDPWSPRSRRTPLYWFLLHQSSLQPIQVFSELFQQSVISHTPTKLFFATLGYTYIKGLLSSSAQLKKKMYMWKADVAVNIVCMCREESCATALFLFLKLSQTQQFWHNQRIAPLFSEQKENRSQESGHEQTLLGLFWYHIFMLYHILEWPDSVRPNGKPCF